METNEIKNGEFLNQIILGDSIELLKKLEDNSIDSIISDPPYGLEFMGKEWDSFKPNSNLISENKLEDLNDENNDNNSNNKTLQAMINFQNWVTEWSKECLRVLKPGGFLVAFGGTRTFHRLAVGIENAGFISKDTIMIQGIVSYMYGTGFPKGTDISKQLDKFKGISVEKSREFGKYLKEKREQANISITQMDELICNGTTNYSWFEGRLSGQRLPKSEQWIKIKEILKLDNEWDDFIGSAERTIIGKSKTNTTVYQNIGNNDKNKREEIDITIPATDIAKEWQGFKTCALKPSYEPILIFMKPIERGLSTVQNIIKWGTGAINVDISRIALNGEKNPSGSARRVYKNNDYTTEKIYGENKTTPDNGRYPANTLLVHHPLCEFKGYKKVKGSKPLSDRTLSQFKDRSNYIFKFGGAPAIDRTDENGLEEVEEWECHPDCMVKILGEQSGEVGAQAPVKKIEKEWGGDVYNKYNGNGDDGATFYNDKGTASRFFKQFNYEPADFIPFYYTSKASKSERNKGCEKLETKNNAGVGALRDNDRPSYPKHNFHPTVKPISIMKYLINMFTKPKYVVLDPFIGSGTTAIACVETDRNFIGFEKNEEYKIIADARIEYAINEKEKNIKKTEQETLF